MEGRREHGTSPSLPAWAVRHEINGAEIVFDSAPFVKENCVASKYQHGVLEWEGIRNSLEKNGHGIYAWDDDGIRAYDINGNNGKSWMQ